MYYPGKGFGHRPKGGLEAGGERDSEGDGEEEGNGTVITPVVVELRVIALISSYLAAERFLA